MKSSLRERVDMFGECVPERLLYVTNRSVTFFNDTSKTVTYEYTYRKGRSFAGRSGGTVGPGMEDRINFPDGSYDQNIYYFIGKRGTMGYPLPKGVEGLGPYKIRVRDGQERYLASQGELTRPAEQATPTYPDLWIEAKGEIVLFPSKLVLTSPFLQAKYNQGLGRTPEIPICIGCDALVLATLISDLEKRYIRGYSINTDKYDAEMLYALAKCTKALAVEGVAELYQDEYERKIQRMFG